MRIQISAPSDAKRHHFLDSVIEQLTKTLARFSKRITSVNVTLTDENGPRGGIDKQCRVSIVMPRLGQLSASATHENPSAAVAQAADRMRRVVLTKLKRPKSLQSRKRRSSSESSGLSSADELETISTVRANALSEEECT